MFVDEYAIVATLLTVILVSFASAWAARTLQEHCAGKALEQKGPEEHPDFVESLANENHIPKDTQSSAEVTGDSLSVYKALYHKVQSLEQHPDIIQESWSTLISFLDEAVASALQTPESGILSLNEYSKATASAYLQREEAAISEEWEQYLSRRRAGSPRELFGTRDDAIIWLKAAAPVKFVDGAWLGHVHMITTPFPLRHVTKDAWQVMSEELGDGDVEKNHVYLFSRLLDSIGVHLPRGDSVDFAHQSLGLDDIHSWKAGLAQLLISLFPHDFLPEILGFNLQFELMTLKTLKASVELAELKIDPYYFVLHITIDNADSGHSAIALQTVNKYIEHKRTTDGDKAAHQAWKRVQTGYILSDFFGKAHTEGVLEPAELEADVRRIFKSKTREARKYHRNSRLKIGRHTLTDWLQPDRWEAPGHQRDFLLDLSSSRSWIHPGDGKASRFIKELEWGGKMFGVFTQRETRVLERWIDSQTDGQTPGKDGYWSFVGRDGRQQKFQKRDIRTDYPVLLPSYPFLRPEDTHLPKASHPFHPYGNLIPTPTANITALLPLWFTHPCLLETAITVPARTITPTAGAIVRLLRAQSGFCPEPSGVDGMDEARRTDSISIVELGFEMAERDGRLVPGSVKEALDWWPSDFAVGMLHAAMKPIENLSTLIGLTWAFVELHEGIARMEGEGLLSERGREVLGGIADREKKALGVCLAEMEGGDRAYEEFRSGYVLGREEIERTL